MKHKGIKTKKVILEGKRQQGERCVQILNADGKEAANTLEVEQLNVDVLIQKLVIVPIHKTIGQARPIRQKDNAKKATQNNEMNCFGFGGGAERRKVGFTQDSMFFTLITDSVNGAGMVVGNQKRTIGHD